MANIDNIDMYPYPSSVSHFGQFNILKSVLYMEKSAIGQQIILNKTVKN